MAAAVSSPQHCGFCRDPIQDGAIQYVEQAMCKKILFWLSDLDSKFNAFDLQQITSNWCQVCFGLSAIVVQNLCDLGERLSPRLATNQSISTMSHTNSVKQEHRSSIAGSLSVTTTTTSSPRAISFNPPATVTPIHTPSTAFHTTASLAQGTLALSHPAQFMAGGTMKAPAPTPSHMGMQGAGVPMLGPGGTGGLSMVTPMMAHGTHLQTIAVNGLPCQPFYTRPEMISHPARAPSVVSTIHEEKPIKVDEPTQPMEQGEKIPKPKKPKKKKMLATANGSQATINHSAEGFSGDFDGTWTDASNFANIAQSFGLMPKGEEQSDVGGAAGSEVSQVNLLDPNMTGNSGQSPSPGKKNKKESMKFHKCFACDKQFTSQKWVRKHMEEKHNIVATFNCDTCGKKFNDRKNFRRHCRLHSEDTPYKCNICGKKCGRNKDLRNHMASHQSEKNFQCSVCGKGYKAMKALRDHMKAHEGVAPPNETPQNSGSPLVLQHQSRETMSAPPPSNNPQQTNSTTAQPSLAQELLDTTGQQQLAMSLQNQVLMDQHAISSHAALLQQRYAETFRTTNLVDLAQTVVALHNPPPPGSHTQSHR